MNKILRSIKARAWAIINAYSTYIKLQEVQEANKELAEHSEYLKQRCGELEIKLNDAIKKKRLFASALEKVFPYNYYLAERPDLCAQNLSRKELTEHYALEPSNEKKDLNYEKILTAKNFELRLKLEGDSRFKNNAEHKTINNYVMAFFCGWGDERIINSPIKTIKKILRRHKTKIMDVEEMAVHSSVENKSVTRIDKPWLISSHYEYYKRKINEKPCFTESMAMSDNIIRKLVRSEMKFLQNTDQSIQEIQFKIFIVLNLIVEEIKEINPMKIIVWGRTAPMSNLMMEAARAYNIPYLVIENSPIADAIFLEQGMVRKEQGNDTYGNFDLSVYIDELKERFKVKPRERHSIERILILGANEIGCGEFENSFEFSNAYKLHNYITQQEALDEIIQNNRDYFEKDNIEVALRKHPSDNSLSRISIEGDNNNIGWLKGKYSKHNDISKDLEWADTIISLGTTVEFNAIALGINTIPISRFSGYGDWGNNVITAGGNLKEKIKQNRMCFKHKLESGMGIVFSLTNKEGMLSFEKYWETQICKTSSIKDSTN